MTQHPKQTNHEPRKALPPPFQALNAPVPRCEAPECGELLHLVLPRSEIEFNARNVTVALVELMQMRSLPKGTDWFVVGANEAGGQTHVTTVGEERIDEQHAIITGANRIGRQRVGDPRDVAARAPADSDRASLHQRGEDRRAGGIPRYTTVAAERDDVDANMRPPPRPKRHHG